MSSCESDSCVLSPDETVPSKIASDEDFYIIDQVGEVDQAGDDVDDDFFVVQAKLSTKDIKSQTCDIVEDGGQDVVLLDDQLEVANGKVKGDDIITLDSTLEEEGSSGDDIFILDTEPERTRKAPATPVCDETTEAKLNAGEEVVIILEGSGKKVDDKAGGDIFLLDTKPEVKLKDKPLGPRYRREFDGILKPEAQGQPAPDDSPAAGSSKCFNCLGDHTVSSCPKPKDQERIARNRSRFKSSQPKQIGNQRYHVEKSSKFDHLKPGKISNSLREALSLASHQIPMHIYNMRIYGYPPGWLEEIKEFSSGMDFVDSTKTNNHSKPQFTYHFDKIIEYPGYNVPPEPGWRDDSAFLNLPPRLGVHSKENFIRQLQMSQCTVREESTNTDQVDMDVSSEASIEELETQRQLLLAELGDAATDDTAAEMSNPVKGESEFGKEEDVNDCSDGASPEGEPEPQTEQATSGRSKQLDFGTPVSIRFSPYNSLPDRRRFSKDIGEHIPFENLPNTTGAFDKMKAIFKRVQNIFKKEKQ